MRVGNTGNQVQGGEAPAAKSAGRSAPSQETKRAERGARPEVEKSVRNGSSTEISAKSREFAQAKAAASNAPEVRDERIAELKKRMANGSYKIDTEAVADRMVDEHLKMSGMS